MPKTSKEKKHIGIAIDLEVHALLKKLAADNCRSIGKQIEWLVRQESARG